MGSTVREYRGKYSLIELPILTHSMVGVWKTFVFGKNGE